MVNIYYTDLSYNYIVESPYYSIIDLLSSFGGQIGLMLGMSVLSLVEIIDLIIQLFVKIIGHKYIE